MRMTFPPSLCGAAGANAGVLKPNPGRRERQKYKVYFLEGDDSREAVKAKAGVSGVFKISLMTWPAVDGKARAKRSRHFFFFFFKYTVGKRVNIGGAVTH